MWAGSAGWTPQAGVVPPSDRFAEMVGIPLKTMAARRLSPNMRWCCPPAAVRHGDTLIVAKLDRLARFLPDVRARGKLRGKQTKLSERQQRELCRMCSTGEYSMGGRAKLFSVSRPTVYRALDQRLSTWPGSRLTEFVTRRQGHQEVRRWRNLEGRT